METRNRVRHGETLSIRGGSEDALHSLDAAAVMAEDLPVVEIEAPLELCREGEWIEHPSASDDPEGLMRLARAADQVIVLLASDALFTASEAKWVGQLLDMGHEPIFVCNFLDRIAENERAEVAEAARRRIPAPPERIFLLSASGALEGLHGGAEALARVRSWLASACERVEQVRLARVRRLIESSLPTAQARIQELAERLATRKQEAEDALKTRYARLEELEATAREVDERLQRFESSTRDQVRRTVAELVEQIANAVESAVAGASSGDLDALVGSETRRAIEAWKSEGLRDCLDALNQRRAEVLAAAHRDMQRHVAAFAQPQDPAHSHEPFEAGASQVSLQDIDINIDLGTGEARRDHGAVNAWIGPDVAVATGISLMLVLVVRPLLLGMTAGALGLTIAVLLKNNRQREFERRARREAARRLGRAVRAQHERIELDVHARIRPALDAPVQRLRTWNAERVAEARATLVSAAQAHELHEPDRLDELRSALDEVRAALGP